MTSPSADVVVVGLGPAGRALAHRCAASGLDVVAVDTHPHRRWTPTYSAWSDELPAWLAPSAVAATVATPAVWTTRAQHIDRTYCVLDTAALQASLSLSDVRVHSGTAVDLSVDTVVLADGTEFRAPHVVDARGTPPGRGLAEQTAFGIVLDRSVAEPVLDGEEAWFMDWRTDNGADRSATPSFLYVVPLPGNKVLAEETCLVGRPALELGELETRLRYRLAARGIVTSGDETIERVRFSVQPPPANTNHGHTGPLRFGARATMMHPATGYSVAASLSTVDVVVEGIRGARTGPGTSEWVVQRLRNLGLHTAMNLAPESIPQFFASFFDLPVELQRAYLSGRTDARGTMTAMVRMFPTLPRGARTAIARTVVNPRART